MGYLVKYHLPKVFHDEAGNHRRWVEAIGIILFLSHNWSLKQKKGGVRTFWKILVTSPPKCWLKTCSGSVIGTLLESEVISKPTRYAENQLRNGNKCVNEFHSVSSKLFKYRKRKKLRGVTSGEYTASSSIALLLWHCHGAKANHDSEKSGLLFILCVVILLNWSADA